MYYYSVLIFFIVLFANLENNIFYCHLTKYIFYYKIIFIINLYLTILGGILMKYTTDVLNNYIKHLELWDDNEISYIKNLNVTSTDSEEWNENEIFKIKSSTKKG